MKGEKFPRMLESNPPPERMKSDQFSNALRNEHRRTERAQGVG